VALSAVVLAAGRGSRLAAARPEPKPLVPVGGVPLLLRMVGALAGAGVRDVHVVVGHRGDEVVAAMQTWNVQPHTLFNPAWERQLGLSVLAAREIIAPGTVLAMTDHLVSPRLLERLVAATPRAPLALAVDRAVGAVFDLDDATKVRTEGARIADIGKALSRFDAIDTGVFRVGPALVAALEDIVQRTGDASLSDGVRALAARGEAEAVDVTGCAWLDVDTPASLREAERLVSAGAFDG
jgi:choline kinase